IEGRVLESKIEPILDAATWDRLRALYDARATGPSPSGRRPVTPYLLGQPLAVTCGRCGGRIARHTQNRRGRTHATYVCANRRNHRTCDQPQTSRDGVDSVLIDVFRKELFDAGTTLESIERATRRAIAETRAQLARA